MEAMNVSKQYPGSGIYAITWFANAHHPHVLRNSELTLSDIFKEVCDIFKKTTEAVLEKDRHSELVKIRQIYCYVSYKLGGNTLLEIANSINRDHTTVIHSKDIVADYIEVRDPKFMRYWNYYLARTTIYVPPKRIKTNIPNQL